MRFNLQEFNNSTNWIKGTIGNYEFEAKHYDKGSQFGIDNGRVSNLTMYLNDKMVVNYERQWGIEPEGNELLEAYNELMDKLESLPERFNGNNHTNFNDKNLDIIKEMEGENKLYYKIKEIYNEFIDYLEL